MKQKLENPLTKESVMKIIRSYREQSLLATALLFWVVTLFIEVNLRIYNLYKLAPDVDVLSHLIAGVAMAASFFWISEKTLIGTPYEGQQNCMDTTNYTINDFYIFMTEHNLLTNFKFKIEEAILKEI